MQEGIKNQKQKWKQKKCLQRFNSIFFQIVNIKQAMIKNKIWKTYLFETEGKQSRKALS